MRKFAVGYERLARTIVMVFVVNVAFLVHTVMGVIFAGFFPSVAASYATFRTWVLDGDRSWAFGQTWTVFHRAWRQELLSANAFGWPQLAVGVLLLWDRYLANQNDMGIAGIAVSGLLFAIIVLFALFVAVSWAIRSHFDERPWWLVRASLRMVLARPVCSLALIVLLAVVAWAWYTWPGILVCFGLATPIFVIVTTIYSFGRLPGLDSYARRSRDPAVQAAG
ncbi:YesL family protein [Microlunatus sp. GCM10028923]|uniref:YesL family protein n=1 Tax=Microlunatus sp. GCM10028923 TaxID=3273400 RepID=UPI00360B8F85